MDERLQERQTLIDRLREIEMQVRGCNKLADETKKSILRGDQYVNYSTITLKSGGLHALGNRNSDEVLIMGTELEAKINSQILQVPLCGKCSACIDKKSRKLCIKRQELRNKLINEYEAKLNESYPKVKQGKEKKEAPKKRTREVSFSLKAKSPVKKEGESVKKKIPRIFTGSSIVRANSLGNKRMSVPDELLPELCSKIGANGTRERMKTINDFVMAHPTTSIRQVTMKFSEITTKDLPKCVPQPDKAKGRAIHFFLRPRLYRLLPQDARPNNWEKYTEEDDLLWKEECITKEKEKNTKDKQIKELMEETLSKSVVSESDSLDMSLDISNKISSASTKRDSLGSSSVEPTKKKKKIKNRKQ